MRLFANILLAVLIVICSSCVSSKQAHHKTVRSSLKPSSAQENQELRQLISEWIGTPHQMGGNSKQGIDCSGFVRTIYRDIYHVELPRQTKEIKKVLPPIKNPKALQEGDLVFFKITEKKTHHVGIYLNNYNFAHTSSSKGVMVSSLLEPYWQKHFLHGGKNPKRK